jgi:MoxR-like ATPase
VTPDDVKIMAPDVLRHRIGLTFEAEAEQVNQDDLIQLLLNSIVIN